MCCRAANEALHPIEAKNDPVRSTLARHLSPSYKVHHHFWTHFSSSQPVCKWFSGFDLRLSSSSTWQCRRVFQGASRQILRSTHKQPRRPGPRDLALTPYPNLTIRSTIASRSISLNVLGPDYLYCFGGRSSHAHLLRMLRKAVM